MSHLLWLISIAGLRSEALMYNLCTFVALSNPNDVVQVRKLALSSCNIRAKSKEVKICVKMAASMGDESKISCALALLVTVTSPPNKIIARYSRHPYYFMCFGIYFLSSFKYKGE